MPENDNAERRFQRADELLLVALASGASIRQSARRVGLGEATVARRLEDQEFRRRLAELRCQLVDRAVGVLAASMASASATLRRLLKAKSETVRLGAARAILEMHVRLKEAGGTDERLAEVERWLREGRRP